MKTTVTNRLSDVLKLVFPEIGFCYYRVDQKTKEEYVRIILTGDNIFEICVTADSAAALVDDVWKECKRRFA